MKKAFLITVFCYLTLFLMPPVNAEEICINPWPGYYVGKADRAGQTQVVIEVDIFPSNEGQSMYIDFKVPGHPPGHIWGTVGEVFNRKKSQFNFVFKDERGNLGRGLFSRHGKKYLLHLKLARRSPTGSVKGYSSVDYVVIKQDTEARKDRHPWSLGRTHKLPVIPEGQ